MFYCGCGKIKEIRKNRLYIGWDWIEPHQGFAGSAVSS